jgi:hypothetical protein
VLRRQLQRRTRRAAEHDRAAELARAHVVHLRRAVEDLVPRQHREVVRHELDDRTQPHHGRTDAHTGEAQLGDRRVDHAQLAEPVEQTLRHLVRAIVEADFLAHQEDVLVALHLFRQRLVQRLTVRNRCHFLPLLRPHCARADSLVTSSGAAETRSRRCSRPLRHLYLISRLPLSVHNNR